MNRNIKKLYKITLINTFVNASFVYILANGIGQGTTLLTNIFFTRYMLQSDYGLYSNYYSYVSILVPIVGANLYVGLANGYMDYRQDIHHFRSSLLLLSVVWSSAVSCVAIAGNIAIGLPMPVVCVVLALIHAYGFFSVNYYIHSMNMENRYIKKALFLCVPNVLQALLAIIAVMLCNSYISRAVGSTIGVTLCGLAAIIVICQKARPRYCAEYWNYALTISLPSIISSVSAMIMQQSDKVMITAMYDAETTAVYALIYNVGYILYAVQQATSGVWQVWYYNILKDEKYDSICVVQKWYMFIMLMIATGLFMVSPELIKILAPSSYWHLEYVTPFILGSYLMLMYQFHISTAQYNKKTGVVSCIVLMAALLNIFLNYNMIPLFGGLAAAYTSVMSYLFIFAISGVYLCFKKQYYFDAQYFFFFGGGTVLIGIVFSFVRDTTLIRYIIFFIILAFEAVYMYMQKNEIKNLLGRSISKI